MAKVKLTDFKKYLSARTEKELRDELLKLFSKLNQVQDFYGQELMSDEDRKKMLEASKEKIHKEFWTRTGNPRNVSNKNVRSIISDFEKIASFPYDIIDLLLYRVWITTDFANQFGGANDADYNAASTAFAKAVKLMKEHNLVNEFQNRCEDLFEFNNLDYWYIADLESIFEEVKKEAL